MQARMKNPAELLPDALKALQALPTAAYKGGVPPHTPLLQWSPVVQTLWSLQVVPFWGVWTHPVAGLQPSVVQGFPSSHSTEAPPHVPVGEQTSPAVHALPSSQDPVIGVCMHPEAGSHVSRVHAFPSSQLGTVCVH